jgi:hypothetical protein
VRRPPTSFGGVRDFDDLELAVTLLDRMQFAARMERQAHGFSEIEGQ